MSRSRLHQLSELGQSVWIDSLSREWLRTGFLRRLIDEDAVVGVTSNPTIFQKAMSEGDWYDDQLREVLRPIWDEGKGQDGYVSLEVDPALAYDSEATLEQALRFHEWVDRPNLFVKI